LLKSGHETQNQSTSAAALKHKANVYREWIAALQGGHRKSKHFLGPAFKKGREFAAWLGIVPGEYTTGGKQKLLGISKRGNSYLRRLFVHGARAVLQQSAKQSSGLSSWRAQLTTRTHRNVAAVALANKLARMAWAVLAKNEPYRPPMLADAATA
jgi:transposase